MNVYSDYQAQQMERAKTFAEIRRIEERLSRMAEAKPEVRRRAVWPFGALAARRRHAVVPRDAAVVPRDAAVVPRDAVVVPCDAAV